MPKGSVELTNARKEEIIAACETLYLKKGFKDITIKDIANETSFTRTSIYNYFETKEEIFLAILQKEYEMWVRDLDELIDQNEKMTKDEVAVALSRSVEKRILMLKLMSMNHYDMEANSRVERLVEFKRSYGESIRAVGRLLEKFCPEITGIKKQNFIYAFFPFIYGIYPYTVVTQKQKEAMEQAEVGFVYLSVYDMAYACVKKLLE